jgi:hypothetical protein
MQKTVKKKTRKVGKRYRKTNSISKLKKRSRKLMKRTRAR